MTEMGWRPIETALKDGTAIRLKREFEDAIFEGEGCWRTVEFASFINGRHGVEPGYTSTSWFYNGTDRYFPTPTHWMPRPATTCRE